MDNLTKAEILGDIHRYNFAIKKILWKHEETNGAFCKGYFAKVAKDCHIKVKPLKALYEMMKNEGRI